MNKDNCIDMTADVQADINTITALALIKQMYLENKISKTVYYNIKKEYVPTIRNVEFRNRM